MSERETALQGRWAENDPRRIFVEGAAWWEWHTRHWTLFSSERDELEAEAEKRYPQPVVAPQPCVSPADRDAAIKWLMRERVGISSETIYRTLMGETIQRADIPYDPDDFSRCYRLLQCVPSFRGRLGEVAARYPAWKPFVEAWDELTALYEEGVRTGWPKPYRMYERMKALRVPAAQETTTL